MFADLAEIAGRGAVASGFELSSLPEGQQGIGHVAFLFNLTCRALQSGCPRTMLEYAATILMVARMDVRAMRRLPERVRVTVRVSTRYALAMRGLLLVAARRVAS